MHDETVTTAGRLIDTRKELRSRPALAPGSFPRAGRGSGALVNAPAMPLTALGETAGTAGLSDRSPARRRETGNQEA